MPDRMVISLSSEWWDTWKGRFGVMELSTKVRKTREMFSREPGTLRLSPGQRSPSGNQVHQVTVEGEGQDEMVLRERGEKGGAQKNSSNTEE